MISQDEVLRQLLAEEAAASGTPAAVAASSMPSTHLDAAIGALAELATREVTTTAELLEYAQAEALVSIALSLAELRNLTNRGKP